MEKDDGVRKKGMRMSGRMGKESMEISGRIRKRDGREALRTTRVRTALLAALAALLCVAACGRQAETGESAQDKEEIVLWSYYETDAQKEALDELVEGFNLSQGVYEASWDYVPMTEFSKKLSMAYTEKALPDLVLIDNPDMPDFIRMDMFEDITGFLEELHLKENYYPALLKTVTYEGRLYGLPSNCNNVALIYNRQMLRDANVEPPRNWAELEEAARILTGEGRSGFLMSAIEGEQGAFQILPWILSAGEETDQIGGEKTAKAFAFISGLIEKGYMTPQCINYSQTDVARIFSRGGAAMIENGPWVFPLLDEMGIDYGVCPLPMDERSSVIAGGENLGILKGKNVEGAKKFLAYYDQDDVMGKFCQKTQVLPTKKNVRIQEDGHLAVFRMQMDRAVVRTSIPSWNTMSRPLSRAVYQMASGERTPLEMAEEIRRVGE